MGGCSVCSVSRRFRASGAAPAPGMHGEKRRQCHGFPFSLYELLRYMLPGAAEETEKQMAAILPEDGKSGGTGPFCLMIFAFAALLFRQPHFADRSVELKDAYEKAVGPDAVAPAPFRENKAEAVRQVNSWAAANTGNRIRNLLNPQRMSDRTVLVLVNAMYLKAFWDSKFERRDTGPRTFVREDGTSCQVPMMKQQVFTEGRSWPRQGGMYYEKDGVRGGKPVFYGREGRARFYGRSASGGEEAEAIH